MIDLVDPKYGEVFDIRKGGKRRHGCCAPPYQLLWSYSYSWSKQGLIASPFSLGDLSLPWALQYHSTYITVTTAELRRSESQWKLIDG